MQESVDSSNAEHLTGVSQETRDDIWKLKELELAHSIQGFEQAAESHRRKVSI